MHNCDYSKKYTCNQLVFINVLILMSTAKHFIGVSEKNDWNLQLVSIPDITQEIWKKKYRPTLHTNISVTWLYRKLRLLWPRKSCYPMHWFTELLVQQRTGLLSLLMGKVLTILHSVATNKCLWCKVIYLKSWVKASLHFHLL